MFEEYKFKIDTHCHSNPASGCSEFKPEEVVQRYKAQNFDGIVLTNHFVACDRTQNNKEEYVKWWLEDYYKAVAEGEKLGIKVYLGMEIRFRNVNNNDYLVYGIDTEDVRCAADYLERDIETFYRDFKNDKNVIFQAHPCRNGIVPVSGDVVDGYEVFNMHPNHNQRVPEAKLLMNKKEGLLMCGGTDFHHPGHEGIIATCVKELPENSFELAEILKSGDFIFNMRGSIIIP